MPRGWRPPPLPTLVVSSFALHSFDLACPSSTRSHAHSLSVPSGSVGAAKVHPHDVQAIWTGQEEGALPPAARSK
eukprot:3358964-Pleurochrysis_carterae.AAC.2